MCLPVTRISASYVLVDRSALSLYLCVFCHIFVGQWRFFSPDQWEAASDTIEFQTRLDSWAIISGRVAEWLKAPDSKLTSAFFPVFAHLLCVHQIPVQPSENRGR